MPWYCIPAAETRLSSALTAILIATVPLVGAAVALATRRTRVHRIQLAGLAAGGIGAIVLCGLNTSGASGAALGEMALVVAGYALAPIVISGYLANLDAVVVATASLALCAALYAPLAIPRLARRPPTAPAAEALVALAVVCTAIALVLFFALIREWGPVRATVVTYVNPAVAALLGVALLGEAFTWSMALGLGLVLSGSIYPTRRCPEASHSRLEGRSLRRRFAASTQT